MLFYSSFGDCARRLLLVRQTDRTRGIGIGLPMLLFLSILSPPHARVNTSSFG